MLKIQKNNFKGIDEKVIDRANEMLHEWEKDHSFGSINWFWENVIYPLGEKKGGDFLYYSFYPSLVRGAVSNPQNGHSGYPEEFKGTWWEVYCRAYSNGGDDLHNLEIENKIKELGYGQPVALLNTSILTDFGSYDYIPITTEAAKNLIANRSTISAIGHQSTADIMSSLLDSEINMNRIQFKQQRYQRAIVFKLKGRPEEGKILTRLEIEKIGYEFGLLIKK